MSDMPEEALAVFKQSFGEMARLQETAIWCWTAKVITINGNYLRPAKWIGLSCPLFSPDTSDKIPQG